MNQRHLFAALTVLAVCVTMLPASAVAATFTFVGTSFRSCWEDTEGFTAAPDLQPNPLPAGTPAGTHFVRQVDASQSGTVIFNTDGTVTSTATLTTMRNTTTSRVVVSVSTCSGTWTLDAATLQVTTQNNCNFTNTIGGTSTGTVVTQSLHRLVGTTLVRVDPSTPFVEAVNVLTGSGAPYSYQRVCGHSGTFQLVQ